MHRGSLYRVYAVIMSYFPRTRNGNNSSATYGKHESYMYATDVLAWKYAKNAVQYM